MTPVRTIIKSARSAGAILFLAATVDAAPQSWPDYRGPDWDGHAPDAAVPLRWSEEENVRWKTAIPGKSNSSPIVWGDRVFVTTAVSTAEEEEPETPASETLEGYIARVDDKVH